MEVIDFTELYNRYSGDVFRYVRYLTGNREVAEEVTAETFLRAWTVQDNLRVATSKGYLIAAARNLVRDEYRRGRREVELDGEVAARDAQPETPGTGPARALQKRECSEKDAWQVKRSKRGLGSCH
jgi:RNA polymerase sigma-70 factor (ECF subfamily)